MIQNRELWLKGISLILVILFISACSDKDEHRKASEAKEAESLFVLSGAGLKVVLDPLGEAFTRKTGIRVDYSYLCSAMLLTNLELTQRGDVFVPGSRYFFNLARDKGLVDENHVADAVFQAPCIMVRKGNPKNIQGLEDLLKPGIKIGAGDPEGMAVARLTVPMLKRLGYYDQFMENVIFVQATANKLALSVCMNSIDAAINWLPTAKSFSHCSDIVLIDKEKVMYSTAPVALCKYSKRKEQAQKFFDFVLSPEGKKIFREHGYGLYFEPKPEQYYE